MNSFLHFRKKFLALSFLTALFLFSASNKNFAQDFSVTDSVVYLKKHTGFGVVHWYAELANHSSSDIEIQWTAYFSKNFQKKWTISWDDQTNYYQNIQDLDSGLFVLPKNANSFKLPFGVAHKGIAGEGSVTFAFHATNQPNISISVTFIIEISEQTTHITEPQNENDFVVYPNPIREGNIVQIKGIKNNSYTYRIINSSGKTVTKGNVNQGTIQIPLFIDEGKYIIKLENQDQNWVLPILKNSF